MSGFVSFLQKLGKYLAEGVAIAAGVGPLVSPLFGSKSGVVQSSITTGVNDLTAVGGVVVQAEALLQGSGNGAAKLATAAPLVANIVKTSELVSGHQIANNALFIQGCTDLTNAVAEILNSLSSNGVNSSGTVISTVPAVTTNPIPVVWQNK
jgi:hypothetical protein